MMKNHLWKLNLFYFIFSMCSRNFCCVEVLCSFCGGHTLYKIIQIHNHMGKIAVRCFAIWSRMVSFFVRLLLISKFLYVVCIKQMDNGLSFSWFEGYFMLFFSFLFFSIFLFSFVLSHKLLDITGFACICNRRRAL